MSSMSTFNVFNKHPAKLTLIVISFFLVDYAAAYFFLQTDQWRNESKYRLFNPYYHHCLKPNVSSEVSGRSGKYHFFTNSIGCKDKRIESIDSVPKTGRKRWLFMGDSFTEGINFAYNNTFVGQIDSVLKDSIEVLNAGVCSYSPKIYYLKTKYLLDFDHLKINDLNVFIDESDIADEIQYQPFRSSVTEPLYSQFKRTCVDYAARKSVLLHWIWLMIDSFKKQNSENENAKKINGIEWAFNNTAYEKWGKTGLKLADAYIDSLSSLCKIEKIKLTLFVYPYPEEIMIHDSLSLQVSHWRNFAREKNIYFVNLFPLFINSFSNPDEVCKRFYLQGDVHWNEEGHKLVSKKLIEYFTKGSS